MLRCCRLPAVVVWLVLGLAPGASLAQSSLCRTPELVKATLAVLEPTARLQAELTGFQLAYFLRLYNAAPPLSHTEADLALVYVDGDASWTAFFRAGCQVDGYTQYWAVVRRWLGDPA